MNWLLLRGLSRDSRHWGEFPSILEEHLTNSKAFVMDLPGFGTERHRISPLSVKRIANDTRRRWLELKNKHGGTWSILSISFGGMVTMDWVHRFPLDFQNAVIINTSSRDTASPLRRLQPRGLKGFIKVGLAKTNSEREGEILSFNCNTAPYKDPQLHDRWSKWADEQPNPISNSIIQLQAGIRFKAPKQLPIRTLFISSQSDRLTHPKCSWELARRYKAPLIFHDVAGHDIPLDAPDWLADQIGRWLDT